MTEAHKAHVQSQFGRAAEDCITSPGHAGGADLDRLLAWGRARGADRVLDVATGGGHTALGFAGFTPSVVATDVTEPMLHAARRFIDERGASGVRFVAADVEALRELAAFILEVEKRRDPSHVRAFTQREWAAFLKAAGLTVIDEMVMEKVREWEQWTERMRMSEPARADLERFVLAAPPAYREAFDFKIDGRRILSFTDRMLLLRADKD